MDDIEAQNHTMTIVLDLYNEYSAPQLNQISFPINVYFLSKWNETSVLYILYINISLLFQVLIKNVTRCPPRSQM